MLAFAANLTNLQLTDRIVIDRTGLDGNFEIDLSWSPLSAPTGPGASNAGPIDLPSLFTATEEQLGLKLEPRLEVIDVIVVDHAELPRPN